MNESRRHFRSVPGVRVDVPRKARRASWVRVRGRGGEARLTSVACWSKVPQFPKEMSDARKKPATDTGHYVVVWQKQANGAWKVVIDAPVSDPPPAPAK